HLRHAAHGPHEFARVVRRQRERRHRRRDVRVEATDLAPVWHDHYRIATGGQALAHRRPVVADRAYRARSRDHHPLHPNMPPFTEITWRVMYPASGESRNATVAATSSG